MAVLPSQRLKFRRYREKQNPLQFDLIIFIGLLLLAVSLAINEMELRNWRSSETSYISTIFLVSFIGGLFRHISPRIVALVISSLAFVALVNVVASIFWMAFFYTITQDRELCEIFRTLETCFEYRVIPPIVPTFTDYLVKIVGSAYFAYACYVNLAEGVFRDESKDA